MGGSLIAAFARLFYVSGETKKRVSKWETALADHLRDNVSHRNADFESRLGRIESNLSEILTHLRQEGQKKA